MSDRELLKMAAKAAGIDLRSGVGGSFWIDSGLNLVREWNPLTDDGDSFRLAVKLNLLFTSSPRLMHFLTLERFSRQGDNDCVATRRAILRAAAEIGGRTP